MPLMSQTLPEERVQGSGVLAVAPEASERLPSGLVLREAF